MSASDPVCTRCSVTSSVLWQRNSEGAIICLDCHTAEKSSNDFRVGSDVNGGSGQSDTSSQSGKQTKSNCKYTGTSQYEPSGPVTRRTTRSHERAKARQQQQQQQQQQQNQECNSSSGASPSPSPQLNGTVATTQPCPTSKPDLAGKVPAAVTTPLAAEKPDTPSPTPSSNGHNSVASFRSRRSLTQSQPVQCADHQSYLVTTNSIQHKGVTFEVGDVVSVLDRDGGVYYAILHGFVLDQYADKYVLLTWLLPKTPNPMYFDPAMFILGPEDDMPRSMEYIEFVCHSPQSRHFQSSYLHNIEQAELWLSSNQH